MWSFSLFYSYSYLFDYLNLYVVYYLSRSNFYNNLKDLFMPLSRVYLNLETIEKQSGQWISTKPIWITRFIAGAWWTWLYWRMVNRFYFLKAIPHVYLIKVLSTSPYLIFSIHIWFICVDCKLSTWVWVSICVSYDLVDQCS
jgi:hypothetical protein